MAQFWRRPQVAFAAGAVAVEDKTCRQVRMQFSDIGGSLLHPYISNIPITFQQTSRDRRPEAHHDILSTGYGAEPGIIDAGDRETINIPGHFVWEWVRRDGGTVQENCIFQIRTTTRRFEDREMCILSFAGWFV